MALTAADSRLNNTVFISGLIFYWVICLVFYNLSAAPVDPSDGVFHYQIARYSWENPANFLNHWGKPMFNILSSPFAQMGYIGMIIFNLLLFSLSSLLLYRLSRHFSFKLAGLSPFILMSSIVFFKMVNAGMTEILMATLTVAALYSFSIKKAMWGAIIASFTIVARPESVIVIPMYGLILALSSNWKSIPFLSIGFLLFSLWGYWGFDKDLLWVITDDPYPFISPYGSGDPDHFLRNSDLIFGPFVLIMMLLAIILFFIRKAARLRKDVLSQALFFSIGVTILVFALHSFLWWKGLKGSLGLIRVMATVLPLAAFTAQYAVNAALSLRLRKIIGGLVIVLLLLSCNHAIQKSELPQKKDERLELITEAADWYKQQNHQGKVSYLAPYFAFKAELNPENPGKVILLWSLNKEDPSQSLQPGDLIIWDSQFGPQEGQIPEEVIANNDNLEIEKYLELENHNPDEKPYRIYIARVKDSASNQ